MPVPSVDLGSSRYATCLLSVSLSRGQNLFLTSQSPVDHGQADPKSNLLFLASAECFSKNASPRVFVVYTGLFLFSVLKINCGLLAGLLE